MNNSSHLDIIKSNQLVLKQHLTNLLKKGDQYILLDFPDHSNVGDNAIWLGELMLLKEVTGNLPKYICTISNVDFKAIADIPEDFTILIHGGGNFGDIWPQHQQFRETVIKSFRNKKIIQLPQSIKFNNLKNIQASKVIFNNHNNLHLLVRDQQSYEFAKESYECNVLLSPDCAFGLGPLKRIGMPKYDLLMLMRTDDEKKVVDMDMAGTNDQGLTSRQIDWLKEDTFFMQKAYLLAAYYYLTNRFGKSKRLCFYNAKAKIRLNRGVKLLSQGKVVLTDRLHAHIICILLDIPNIVLDNNYGKISGYITQWTQDYQNSKLLKVLSKSEVGKFFNR